MPSDLDAFLASLHGRDRHFREDLDLVAGRRLRGEARDRALDALVRALDEGQDARVPRALAALDAREHATDLRVAMTLGQPAFRAEAARAWHRLGGTAGRACEVLRAVLQDPAATVEGRVRAIIGLEELDHPDADDALRRAIISDPSTNVRGNAFDGRMRRAGLAGRRARNSRLDALYQLLTSERAEIRTAYEPDLDILIEAARQGDPTGWLDPVDVKDPAFEDLRQRLVKGRPAGPREPLAPDDVGDLDPAPRLLLQAWAVHLLDRDHPGALDAARAIGVRGLPPSGTGAGSGARA